MNRVVLMRLCATALLSVVWLTGCPNPPPPEDPPAADAGTPPDENPPDENPTDGGEPPDGGTTPTEDPGIVPDPVPDPGQVSTDPNNPANASRDSDCDGLTDSEEYATVYGPQKLKTSPGLRDTDGDGIRDGVELGRTSSINPDCTFFPDADTASRTSPIMTDTDGDGLSDGLEDLNRNGKREANETDPTTADSDGDGLADGSEDANRNAVVSPGETDPRRRDTDDDGIPDGAELSLTGTSPLKADTDGDTCRDGDEDKNQNGVVDSGESNPKVAGDCGGQAADADGDGVPDSVEESTGTDKLKADTDGDGLSDGVEDRNRNGRVDSGETDARTRDTDCDGLLDGATIGALPGEDLNGNGQREATETSPTNPDSDGDGLLDGVERGVATSAAPVTTCGYVGDAHPTSTTDPLNNDSDGDDIQDGAEDSNQNGAVDSGELDPKNGADGAPTTPAGQACSTQNLRAVSFKEDSGADIRLALRPTFQDADLSPLTVAGKTVGYVGYDSTRQVTFIAYKRGQVTFNNVGSTTAVGDEDGIRKTSFPGVGVDYTQTFSTWDGFPAIAARYTRAASSEDLKSYTNALVRALVPNSTGSLLGTGGGTGEFKLQAQYVHRSDNSVLVVLALTRSANFTEAGGLFTLADTAGGSALAQFGDTDAVQCETFTARTSAVDFLFVVDDSCSMATSQGSLASAASAVEAKLGNSSLDWRLGMVTTSYNSPGEPNTNHLRAFTTNMNQFKAWLTKDSICQSNGQCSLVSNNPPTTCTNSKLDCWMNIDGTGTEKSLGSAQAVVNYITASTTTRTDHKLRPGAKLVIVVLTDTKDQSAGTTAGYISYFGTAGNNPAQQVIQVHGIICPPDGPQCDSSEDNKDTRLTEVIAATGGVYGSIRDTTSINTTINAIIDSVISSSGYKTLKAPIGASMKVAVADVADPAVCPSKSDLPRSRTHGFDVDGLSQAVSFFGACRPAVPNTTQVALSYRYWVDRTALPDGSPPPCQSDTQYFDGTDPDFCRGTLSCNRTTDRCECPEDCGGGGTTGQYCNTDPSVCEWQCAPDCGGACGSFKTCDTSTCGCTCVQSATCAPGFRFDSSVCGCVCDTAALDCGSTYNVDANSCACVCKSDCGGCGPMETCNTSLCACQGLVN